MDIFAGKREIDGGGQKLEDELSAVTYTLRIRVDHHAGGDLTGARRYQGPRAVELHDAESAGIHRRQVLEEAERGNLDPFVSAGVEKSKAFRYLDSLTIDAELDQTLAR
jgi:hypothetical protein